jgi:serine/threonine protein phosphatase PrpC
MLIKSFGHSDVGRRREKNEDSFLVNDERRLYLVADGMGGHLGGEFASKLAVATIDEIVKSLEDDPEMTLPEGESLKPGDFSNCLRFAIREASRRIFEKANEDSNLHGMGTTTVAILFRNNKAYIANVGDSRVYRIRGKRINQITKDHSLVGEQIRAGLLSADDSRVNRLKNIITRSVGFQEDVDSDVDIRPVKVGDRFLLCSDGLSNLVQDEEIRDVVLSNELEPAVLRLIDIANERGGDDNITAVITEVVDLDKTASSPADDTTLDSG